MSEFVEELRLEFWKSHSHKTLTRLSVTRGGNRDKTINRWCLSASFLQPRGRGWLLSLPRNPVLTACSWAKCPLSPGRKGTRLHRVGGGGWLACQPLGRSWGPGPGGDTVSCSVCTRLCAGHCGQEQKVLEACPSHPSPARTMLSSSISFILEFRKLLIIFILLIT